MWFLQFEETKFKVHEKPMNYCSRCHVRLAAPVGLSGNIHHDRCAPSIKGRERDLATKTSANEQGRREIASLLSLVMGLWAFTGLDFNHTGGRHSYTTELRQTGILANPETLLTQQSLKQDRTVHNRSRYKYGAQNTSMQFCAIASKRLLKSVLCYVDKQCRQRFNLDMLWHYVKIKALHCITATNLILERDTSICTRPD